MKLNFNYKKKAENIKRQKYSMRIKFIERKSSSVKSIVVKWERNIKCTSRFMSGKLLTFAKLLLKSFIYSLVELLQFPKKKQKKTQ